MPDRPGLSLTPRKGSRGPPRRGLTHIPCPLYSAGFAATPFGQTPRIAPVAELVDALDSKSSSARSAGSIPARGTRSSSHSTT